MRALLFPALVLTACFALPLGAQQGGVDGVDGESSGYDRDVLSAREEFRVGVQAYNRYAFNEAILSFERALSFRPGEPLILDWLGRAYYRSGLEDTALRQWQAAAEGYGLSSGEGLLIGSRIETVRNRRGLYSLLDDEVRYVEAGRYPGRYDGMVLYRQPTAVLAQDDGSAWVVAYGTNEIVRIDVNGVIRRRSRGPPNGFDRPYDLVRGLDGRLYLSEFRGGRISVLSSEGEWQSYIGSKGLAGGMLVGPQNLTVDDEGYLYVAEYGNRRISKIDPDGAFILSFGTRRGSAGAGFPGFPGFLSPTGIAAGNGRIYAADGIARCIYTFDKNGTYLGVLVGEGLTGPESIRLTRDGQLLVADTNRILLIDPNSSVIRELGRAGSSKVRLIGAETDRNGNILAANFQADEVSVMTRLDDMASGLFVRIDRVIPDNFPLVTVELQVQDRLRRPIVGLDARNFILSEGGKTVAEQNFLGAGYRETPGDIAILMAGSPEMPSLEADFAAAIRDIDRSGRVVSVIAAGEQPVRARTNGPGGLAGGGVPVVRGASYSPRWRFDLGLRLAATDLLPGAKKRAVVFISAGSLGELAFEQYGLSELSAYLGNNGIIFHAVIIGDLPAGEEIRYLCEQTGGQVMPLYRPEGIGPVLRSLEANPSGAYTFSYRSQLPTDFGRAYMPVEAEVYLLERSGRDQTGYFPPLD
jgi:DNA-binding beta-propeller fold protein YncE